MKTCLWVSAAGATKYSSQSSHRGFVVTAYPRVTISNSLPLTESLENKEKDVWKLNVENQTRDHLNQCFGYRPTVAVEGHW